MMYCAGCNFISIPLKNTNITMSSVTTYTSWATLSLKETYRGVTLCKDFAKLRATVVNKKFVTHDWTAAIKAV